MGTKFTDFFETTPTSVSYLHGKSVAIDGMNMLFQILHNPYQKKQNLPYGYYLDRTQRVITHLYGWLQKIKHFYKAKFLPVVVFDGKPDTFKRMDHKNHAKSFLKAQENYKNALSKGDLKNARNFALSKSFMFINCVQESKKLLEALGIPVIMAPTEAESQCAYLQQVGLVDLVVSNDYDIVLFGATQVIRKLTFQSRINRNGKWISTKPSLELINVKANLERLKLTREQLIDASLLLGNDFFPGIAHLGSKRVLQSLYQYGSIDNMRAKHPSLFKQLSIKKYQYIQNIFLNPSTIHPKPSDLQIKPFNRKGLEYLLLEDHTLNKEKINKKLDILEKSYEKFAKKSDTNTSCLTYTPAQFDIHLQRRLARANVKKRMKFTKDAFEFHSADTLPEQQLSTTYHKKNAKKKQKTTVNKTKKLQIKGKTTLEDYF